MIGIDHIANTLGIDTNTSNYVSDYFYNDTTIFKINKMNNWRFLVRAIIDQSFYVNDEKISVTHPNLPNQIYGTFNVSSRFLSTNISLTRIYNVTNCNDTKIYIFFFLSINIYIFNSCLYGC